MVEKVTRNMRKRFPEYYDDMKQAAWEALSESQEGKLERYYQKTVQNAIYMFLRKEHLFYERHAPVGEWIGQMAQKDYRDNKYAVNEEQDDYSEESYP